MSSVIDKTEQLRQAQERLRSRVPQSSDILIDLAERGTLSVAFTVSSSRHGFLLRREAGLWYVREWVLNGRPQKLKVDGRPSFDGLIAETLGDLRRPPKIKVVDLRCPEKHRQLFAKLIIQSPGDTQHPSNLIEVSCPFCKRTTGVITYHYFDYSGSLVKTEATEPYIYQEPGTWFKDTPDSRPPSPTPKNSQTPPGGES